MAAAMAASPVIAQSVPASGRVTATAQSQVVIVQPLTLVKSRDLNFGRLAVSSAAGAVTINAQSGACTATGGVVQHGTCTAAQFVGMGTRNMNARISLNAVTSLTGPGTPMTLSNVFLVQDSTISFAGNPNSNGQGVGLTQGNGNQRYSINSSTGIFSLNIGATLNVNANQTPGVYSGSITVTVQYQ